MSKLYTIFNKNGVFHIFQRLSILNSDQLFLFQFLYFHNTFELQSLLNLHVLSLIQFSQKAVLENILLVVTHTDGSPHYRVRACSQVVTQERKRTYQLLCLPQSSATQLGQRNFSTQTPQSPLQNLPSVTTIYKSFPSILFPVRMGLNTEQQ